MPQSIAHLAGLSLEKYDVAEALTAEEQAPFAEYKARMSDEPSCDDVTLVRFMRADSCNLDKSEARLRATLAWRQARGVNMVLDNPPKFAEQYQRLRIRSWMGEDATGRPVQFERLGAFFGSGNCDALTKEEWLQATCWDMERLMAKMKEASVTKGSTVHEYCFVADVTGYELVNGMKTIPLLQTLTEEIECHYPEIAGAIVLFNCPPMLTSLFNRVVKPFMDPITAGKVEMHSGVPLERFREIMGTDASIPVCYGGTNTTAFPETEVWVGDLSQPREGEHPVEVKAGKNEDFSLDIDGGMTVTWGMRVVDYNVKYTAAFEPAAGGGARIELGETEEGGKDDHAEGMFVSDGPGKLVIHLGNEHSWMRAKKCFISVDQVPAPVEVAAVMDESVEVGAPEPEPHPAS